MTEHHKELLGMISTTFIVLLSIYVVHRFIPSMLWAGIITMISYPLYEQFKQKIIAEPNSSAFLFTTIVSVLIFFPLFWLLSVFISETQSFINFVMLLHQDGGKLPVAITSLPWIGDEINALWQKYFNHPEALKKMLSHLHLSLMSTSYYLKKVGLSVVHRSFQLGFTVLCLFFFYRDGRELAQQIDQVGVHCLDKRWTDFASQLPQLLRATLNGTVMVGLGVGIIMGILYHVLAFPAPAIAGFFTAIAAMIPFVVPVVFISVSLVLALKGSLLGALIILIVGTIVMFIADHFIKPVLIGGGTRLHFLMVLFGILGGVEAFGLMGLFVGPIVMVLFLAL